MAGRGAPAPRSAGAATGDLAEAGFPSHVLTDEERESLERSLRRVSHQRGHFIFRQDDPPDGIYCISSGEVLLESVDHRGNLTAFFIAARGDVIGHRSLFAGERHAATARALSPCRILFVSADMVQGLVARNPTLGHAFLRILAQDPGPVAAPLLRNPYIPAGPRLAQLLLLCDRFGRATPDGGMVYQLPLSQSDIGALVGARRETVVRMLHELERAGLLRLARRSIVVPDRERLAAFAAGEGPP